MKNLLTTALASVFLFCSTTTFAKDVVSTGALFVKVTKDQDLRRFELCNKDTRQCVRIGHRDYTINELENLKNKLAWQTGASSVISVLGIACAGVGIMAGGSALAGAGLFTAGVDVAGAGLGAVLIGGSVGGTVLAVTSKYNPVSLYNRMDSVNSDVVEDRLVTIKGGDAEIKDFAKTLNNTLSEIE